MKMVENHLQLVSNGGAGNSKPTNAAAPTSATSSSITLVDGIKSLEQIMANATTPIFYRRNGQVIIGTGFFYRNSMFAGEIISKSSISKPQVKSNKFYANIGILRNDYQSGWLGTCQFLLAYLRVLFRRLKEVIFDIFGVEPKNACTRSNTYTVPKAPTLHLVTTKSIFKHQLQAIDENSSETSDEQLSCYSFTYRTASSAKFNRNFVARFKFEDIIEHPSEDLAAVDVGKLLAVSGSDDDKNNVTEICCLTPNYIRSDAYLAEHFGVAERVTLFGFCYNYCSDGEQQWLEDDPIARTGFTAFPPSKRFHGKNEGVVSMISYSGFDCGAPILMRRSGVATVDGNTNNGRACFLGILRQWNSIESLTGNNQQQHSQNQRMILGKYAKAGLLLNIDDWQPIKPSY